MAANVELRREPTYWQIARSMVQTMHSEGTLWKEVGLLVTTVASAVVAVYCTRLTIKHILDKHAKLAERGWVVITYDPNDKWMHHPLSSRPYSLRDVVGGYVESIPVLFLIFFPVYCAKELYTDLQPYYYRAIASIYAQQAH